MNPVIYQVRSIQDAGLVPGNFLIAEMVRFGRPWTDAPHPTFFEMAVKEDTRVGDFWVMTLQPGNDPR